VAIHLGISGIYGHDSAAAIIVDDKVVAASEEERYVHKKHTGDFPYNSIKHCLEIANVSPEDVDTVSFPFQLDERIFHSFQYNLDINPRRLQYMLSNNFSDEDIIASYAKARDVESTIIRGCNDLVEYVSKTFPNAKLNFQSHHKSHAASAAFLSEFSEGSVMVNDLIGEWKSTSVFNFSGNDLTQIAYTNFPDSLGKLYQTFTKYLGFRPNSDEFKVMGLAAYGNDNFTDFFQSLVHLEKFPKLYSLDASLPFTFGVRPEWDEPMEKVLGSPRNPNEEIDQRHADIARGIQNVLETVLLHIVSQPEISPNLCLAGGVSLNALANQKLRESDFVNNLFIQPSSYDAGAALGAAILSSIEIDGIRPNIDSYYLGFEESETSLKDFWDAISVSPTPFCPLNVAESLAMSKVTGLFQGRIEFGPRALGNRSIIASPLDPYMKDILNSKIKFREPYRPFAPVVREEDMAEFFEGAVISPYMTQTFTVRKEFRNKLPSITHEDGTARVQTINRKQNKRLYDIISEFGRLTGIPVIINTSMNLNGDTMALTAQDAYKTFINSGIDELIIENGVIRK